MESPHQPTSTAPPAPRADEREDALYYTLLALALAVAETLLLYLAVSLYSGAPPLAGFLGRAPDEGLPWFAAVMLSRGLLQPLNVCLFGFGVNLLAIRLWNTGKESKAFSQQFFAGVPSGPDGTMVISEETRRVPAENLARIAEGYTGTLPLLVRRLEIGSRRLAEEGDANQVQALMQAVADIDRKATEDRYTLIRYLTWLIPTIGFLGTVMGIGRAISGFSGVMAEVARGGGDLQAQLQPLLGGVAGDLGVAFDTTLLALLLSALIVAIASVVQSREEGLLSAVDDYCLRNFISRIAVPDFGTKQIGDTVQHAVMSLGQAMMAQRAGGEGEDFSVRDLAGQMAAQGNRLEKILAELRMISQKLGGEPAAGAEDGPAE